MNWSKGLTVKERILLHLLSQASYSDHDEVPDTVTQQGIAEVITAPRPHVSMALKDLRTQDNLTERVCRVKHRGRKQKVYFLTSSGVLQAKSLKQRILESKIKVIAISGEEQLKVSQATLKHHLSLFELLNRLTSDGVLDLTKPPTKLAQPAIDADGSRIPTFKPVTPKPGIDNLEIGTDKSIGQPIIQSPQTGPLAPGQESIHINKGSNDQFGNVSRAQRNYIEYLRDYYPEYYKSYYPGVFGPSFYKPSEKTSAGLFFLGYILMLLGVIFAMYLIITGELLALIPMILLLIFGITTTAISATRLWYFEHWQSKILNLLVMTCPIFLYVLFFTAVESSISYYDLGLWLIIIFSCFGLASFGTFIPLHRRAQALATLGIIIIINATISILISTLTMYYAGFWLLSGVLCIYLGHNLVIKEIGDLYLGIALGLALGILIACAYFSSVYDFDNTPGEVIHIYILLLLWILISIILIVQSLRYGGSVQDPEAMEKIIRSLYSSLPIYFGIILIFFGVFLFRFNKLIETVVELFLGFVVILYGALRLKDYEWSQLLMTGLFAIAIIYSLVIIIFS